LNPSSHTNDARVLLPDVLAYQQTSNDSVTLTLKIPANLTYFAGHFDQIPIVPGVVQLQWAVHYAHQYLGLNRHFHQMEAVKFKELLMPDQPLELHLHFNDQAGKLDFCYRSETAEYSSGRLYFHEPGI
jgi:3-hydroxymyristoyl/3-hydroxydecanoyl-(acyl carrier protein) dehydratases